MNFTFLVLIGAATLLVSLIPACKIIARLPGGKTRKYWYILTALIVVFIGGYIFYYFETLLGKLTNIRFIVPAVFLGGGVFVFIILLLSLQTVKVLKKIHALEEENITDPLMKIYNRRCFDRKIREEFAKASRYGFALSLILFDIDNFKTINDEYGHNVGDRILQEIGKILLCSTRDVDAPARYGGDEVAIITPNSTLEESRIVAERILELLRKDPLIITVKGGTEVTIHCTVSVGIASVNEKIKTAEDLIDAADKMMYIAKSRGRDCVICEQ